jgi:hypothetical protein
MAAGAGSVGKSKSPCAPSAAFKRVAQTPGAVDCAVPVEELLDNDNEVEDDEADDDADEAAEDGNADSTAARVGHDSKFE